ncbi:unnamed protein product [Phytophthora fragariaefolia]|uniref:Unnamed protein product n=1 Tax=Phytophthora fragariaefolia TaxID=1490495 RepID=A0A9W7D1V1_9STRA|nr:unnamed protein product [Phytophthora fragariaefolia]
MVNAIGDYGAQPGPYGFTKDADSDEAHKGGEDPKSKAHHDARSEDVLGQARSDTLVQVRAKLVYKKAESHLEKLDAPPERWPAIKKLRLDKSADIVEALYSDVGGEEDDETQDTTCCVQPEVPSTPPAKRPRPAQDRKRSALARKDYSELTPTELREVESPGLGVMSWRHFGILVKFPPGTANAFEQTSVFPDYTPNLTKASEVEAIRARWKPALFKMVWRADPWDAMLDGRSKYLLLHKREDLSPSARSGLEEIVEFMRKNRRAFWLFCPWFFIQ